MSRIVYFDCASGASGDMLLGAVVDLGLPIDRLREELAKLPLPGYRIEARGVTRSGLAATKVDVVAEGPSPAHRHLRHILELLEASALEAEVKDARGRALPPPGGGRGRRARDHRSRRCTSTRSAPWTRSWTSSAG